MAFGIDEFLAIGSVLGSTASGLVGGGGKLSKPERDILNRRLGVGEQSYWKLPELEEQLTADIDQNELNKMSRMLQLANAPALKKFLQTAGARFGNRSGLTQQALTNATIQSLYMPLAEFYQNLYNRRQQNLGDVYSTRAALARV
ncbi:MAG: hypothetical protein AB1690_02430 [Candidatus Zixiibacteriota bacterium]